MIKRFDFSRFLGSETRSILARPENWRWVAHIGCDGSRAIRNPELEEFLRDARNLHSPKHRRVMLVLEGESIYALNGKVYSYKPATVFLFGREDSSQFRYSAFQTRKKTCHLWLHLRNNSDCLTFEIRRNTLGRFKMEMPRMAKTSPLVVQIGEVWDQCEAYPSDEMGWFLLKTLLTTCFLEILSTVEPNRSPTVQQQVITSIQDYICTHVAEDLHLETLAQRAGYSPSFFHHLFRKQTGITPQEFVNRARLDKAEQLLNENYTVEAVAEMVGLESVSYFRRFFKSRMRLTPGVYRKLASRAK